MQVGLIGGPAIEAGVDDAAACGNGCLVAEIARGVEHEPGRIGRRRLWPSAIARGEPVGLVESESCWSVSYGPITLGTIAYRADELRKPKRKGCGLGDNAARCPQGPQPQQQQT